MFNSPFNPYTELGVAKDASKEDIKKAYRELAKNTHPDKNGGNDSLFKRINEAYQILMDDDARQNYDTTGNTQRSPNNLDAKANQLIVNFFTLVAAELDTRINPLSEDLIGHGKLFVQKQIDKFYSEIQIHKRTANLLEKIEARLKSKTKDGLVNRALKHNIEATKDQIRLLDGQIKACERALELLDNYEFKMDPKQVMWSSATGFNPMGV